MWKKNYSASGRTRALFLIFALKCAVFAAWCLFMYSNVPFILSTLSLSSWLVFAQKYANFWRKICAPNMILLHKSLSAQYPFAENRLKAMDERTGELYTLSYDLGASPLWIGKLQKGALNFKIYLSLGLCRLCLHLKFVNLHA